MESASSFEKSVVIRNVGVAWRKPLVWKERREEGANKEIGYLQVIDGKKGVRLSEGFANEKKEVRASCVGLLKSKEITLRVVDGWLDEKWGKMVKDIRWLTDLTIWILMSSDSEVEEVIGCHEEDSSSPFLGMERWMEVLPELMQSRWFRLYGVPLHDWSGETFQLLGQCFGEKVEVDPRTKNKEEMRFGRVQVGLGSDARIPFSINLWIHDLMFMVKVEEESSDVPEEGRARKDFLQIKGKEKEDEEKDQWPARQMLIQWVKESSRFLNSMEGDKDEKDQEASNRYYGLDLDPGGGFSSPYSGSDRNHGLEDGWVMEKLGLVTLKPNEGNKSHFD